MFKSTLIGFDLIAVYDVPVCSLMTQWRLNRGIEQQTKAFLDGFNNVVPLYWLAYFDERELEVTHCFSFFYQTVLLI